MRRRGATRGDRMRVPRTRWHWLRSRRRRELTAGEGLDRRTVLMGAAATAATAGAVAAGASSAVGPQAASAAPALAATNLAIAQVPPDTLPASQVTVVPTGEITKLDAQAVFEDMDRRLSRVQMFEDLQVAMSLVDDFM